MQTTFTDGAIGIRRFLAWDADALYEAADESRRELAVWMPWCPTL
jgi:hypothetical protein